MPSVQMCVVVVETCLNVDLGQISHGKYKNVTYTKYHAHKKEWCREGTHYHIVKYFFKPLILNLIKMCTLNKLN